MELNHLGLVDDYRPQNSAQQEKAHKAEQEKFLATHEAPTRLKRLNAKEQSAKRKEENTQAVSKYKFNKQEELVKERTGRILHEKEIIRKLQEINPRLVLNEFSASGLRGIALVNPLNGSLTYTGTSLQVGYSPEYSTMRFDEYDLPTKEKYRGWRSVLLNLIRGQFISEQDADRVFGPALGPESHRYLRQLWEIRNKRPYDG